MNDLFADNKISKWDIALAGQATEHKYIGVNCGIMDQFASVFGQEGKLCAWTAEAENLNISHSIHKAIS